MSVTIEHSMLKGILIFIVLPVIYVSSDIISCGGFVKSSVPGLLQKVTIQFLNKDGHVKHSAACNPGNGYYMVPVYSKGTYRIKVVGPDGYVFEPSERTVDITDEKNDCKEDLIFSLHSFQVTGAVSSGKGTGSKLRLALYSEAGKKIAEAETDSNGKYTFNAPPGHYVVSTVQEGDSCVERGSVPVSVVDKPVIIDTDLKISGHSLKVHVTDASGVPFSGVSVVLHSAAAIPFDKQVTDIKPESKKVQDGFDYTLKSPKSGHVVFSCLPPGSYKVSSAFSVGTATLEFNPLSKVVTIGGKQENVAFEASGFNIQGFVGHKSQAIGNVVVTYKSGNVVKTAVSNADGMYHIKNIAPGNYVVTGTKDKVQFDQVTARIGVNGIQVPSLTLKKVEVCGQIMLDNFVSDSRQSFVVNFASGDNKVQSVSAQGPENKFCVHVVPGRYVFKPAFSEPAVHPQSREVDVTTEPVHNIIFTEFKASLSGKLVCLDDCNTAEIVLSQSGHKLASVKATDSKFFFSEISPGDYELTVSDRVDRCWEKKFNKVKVEFSDVNDVVIKQNGYGISVKPTQSLTLHWSVAGKTDKVTLSAGVQSRFCIPQRDTYKIKLESCHYFKLGNSFNARLPDETIDLTIIASQANVQFTSPSVDLSSEAFTVKMAFQGFDIVGALDPKSSDNHKKTFQFKIPQEHVNTALEIIPSSNKFLFSPIKKSVTFNGNCLLNIPPFTVVEGKYVSGKVTPALANVEVTVTNKKDKTGLKGVTDSAGRFKIGLVVDPADYDVELSLEGYKFTDAGSGNFKATKLSKLVVLYEDEKTKAPLNEVLVSVSGGVDYRSNVIVDENGRKTFVGLPAGEYFITSVLREYEFDPPSISVVVKEGETVQKKVFGKRFAYSVFGKVEAAGGFALKSVTVEAVSEDCGNVHEEDVTNANGRFRIRGLKPGCNYKIFNSPSSGARSVPPFVNLQAKSEDIHGLEFVLIVAAPRNELIGLVEFEDLVKPKSLRVDLYENGARISTDTMSGSGHLFSFLDLLKPGKEYKVSVNERDLRAMDATAKPVLFRAVAENGGDLKKQVVIQVKRNTKKVDVETSRSNIFGVIFVVLVTIICMNLQNNKNLALDMYEKFLEVINRETSAADKRRKAKKSS